MSYLSFVAQGWIDITEPTPAPGVASSRRGTMLPGLTRIGGGEADIGLGGVGTDQLHVWDDPPRVVFVGAGVPPACGGVPFAERELRTGDRIDWGPIRLEFTLEPLQPAPLEEITEEGGPERAAPAGTAVLTDAEARCWNRVRAGLYVDLGVADPGTVKRLQRSVLEGEFDADACATELVDSRRRDADELLLLERSGRLMRDFLMASFLKGAKGAGRAARQATRGFVAMAIAQGIALLVLSLIVFLCLALFRFRGHSVDQLLDRVVPGGG